MTNEKILHAIKALRESSKKRKFPQSFDLIINLKELDMKRPESKINDELALPHGKGTESFLAVFSDSLTVEGAKVFTAADVDRLSKNKREARKIAQQVDFIVAEPKLMALVGKTFGQFLGPKGKIPKVIAGDPRGFVESYKRSIRLRTKDSPVMQTPVGKENMTDEQVAENIEAVLQHLQARLPKGKTNIGEVLLKMTMSKPVRIEV